MTRANISTSTPHPDADLNPSSLLEARAVKALDEEAVFEHKHGERHPSHRSKNRGFKRGCLLRLHSLYRIYVRVCV